MSPRINIAQKIMSWDQLSEKISQWRSDSVKIVFTNGCFDILHYGHVLYLAKAKELGDKLIIGLNSDDSVKKLKGKGRPINKQEHRAFVLAALSVVDAVVIFKEETPDKLIKFLVPDVLVKGGDYKIEDVVGADTVVNAGGKVSLINFVDGFSTTDLLKKI